MGQVRRRMAMNPLRAMPDWRSRVRIPNSSAKWYYAVAQGYVLGVYTDWGQAKWQVNGYSGAVHKKLQDRQRAEKFMRENRDPEDE
jgi:viroplasmin and RNaseH domain-containing protein